MNKFNQFADKYLVPIANKVGTQRHIQAIKDGMTVAIPLSILGGMCLIVATPPIYSRTSIRRGYH